MGLDAGVVIVHISLRGRNVDLAPNLRAGRGGEGVRGRGPADEVVQLAGLRAGKRGDWHQADLLGIDRQGKAALKRPDHPDGQGLG